MRRMIALFSMIAVVCCSQATAMDPNQLQYDSDNNMDVMGSASVQVAANTYRRGTEDPNGPTCAADACDFDSSSPLSNSGLNYRYGTCIQNLSCRVDDPKAYCQPPVHEFAEGSATLNSGWVCSANKAAIGYSAAFSSSAGAAEFLVLGNASVVPITFGSAETDESIEFEFFVPGNGVVYVTKSLLSATNSCGNAITGSWSLYGPGTGTSWSATLYESGSASYTDSPEISVSRGAHSFSASFSASASASVSGGSSCGCSTPCDEGDSCGASATYQLLLRYYPKCVLPGDLTGDGDVDAEDLAILLSAYGSSALDLPDGDYNPDADLDGDGDVDLSDYTILISNYSQSC